MKKILMFAVVALLFGCGQKSDVDVKVSVPLHNVYRPDDRFIVTRELIIEDDIAYGSRRAVYTLVDKKTGKEYVGLSGVGIAETGTQFTGKSAVQVER